jgi:phosphate transport system substrate-binding protein
LSYATLMKEKLGFGAVRNRAGNFVAASPASVAAAAASLEHIPDDLTFSLIDTPGPDAYPISGTDWAVFYRRLPAAEGPLLVAFFRWATDPSKGQSYAADLGYAPLPPALVERIRAALDRVQFEDG